LQRSKSIHDVALAIELRAQLEAAVARLRRAARHLPS
jgi:hypothetical protein